MCIRLPCFQVFHGKPQGAVRRHRIGGMLNAFAKVLDRNSEADSGRDRRNNPGSTANHRPHTGDNGFSGRSECEGLC